MSVRSTPRTWNRQITRQGGTREKVPMAHSEEKGKTST